MATQQARKGRGVIVFILLVIVALFVAGFIGGAIGSSFFPGNPVSDAVGLPEPGVHLAPQQILGDQAGVSLPGEGDHARTNSFVLTNTILSSLIASGLLVLLFALGTASLKIVPGRLQAFLELAVESLLGFFESVVGKDRARAVFPVIATIFLFVVVNAWLGLVPVYQSFGITRYDQVSLAELDEHFEAGAVVTVEDLEHEHLIAHATRVEIVAVGEITKPLTVEAHRIGPAALQRIEAAGGAVEELPVGLNATFVRPAGTDLNMPLALAIISFVFVEGLAFKMLGFGYLGKFFRFGQLLRGRIGMGLIDLFVGLLELISEFVRLISFTFRLFGNMTAGEILLLVSAFLGAFVVTIPFYGLELLVGFVQALIFAGLTLVFAAIAMAPHEAEHDEQH